MGRTGSSLDGRFPPQGGGSSPRQVDPMDGRKTERPLDKMVVVGVVSFVLALRAISISSICQRCPMSLTVHLFSRASRDWYLIDMSSISHSVTVHVFSRASRD